MSFSFKSFFGVAALLASSLAAAAPVSLGAAGSYGLVSFGDFNASNNSIAGSVAVAGNLSAASFSLNGSSLVVGGDLNYRNGSIRGDAYVGGTRSTSSIGFSGQWQGGPSPVDFTGLSQQMQTLSSGLAGVAATGSERSQYGGLYLSGTGSAVEVFDLDASDLSGNGWSSLSGLASGASIILNISGSDVRLSNGMLGGLGNYNVLLNFYEAQTLTLQSVGLDASILAPSATVLGSSGSISGNVVVGNWNAGITLGQGHAFRNTELASYEVPQPPQTGGRPVLDDPANDQPAARNDVPEPGNLALFALGLAVLGLARRRVRSAA